MKTRRTFLARAALPVLLAGAFAWWGGTFPAGAADAGTTTEVSVSGTVSGAPESVNFAGTASVTSRLSPDPDFGNHKVVLIVDLRNVGGVGASTQTKYVILGPDIMHRSLGAADLINITFPFTPAGTTGVDEARSGLASFALSFDVNTGAVTAASAAVGTPNP